MSRDVSDWMQEVFGDVRNYAVPGATPDQRRDALNEYLQHPATLAAAAPPSLTAAKSVHGVARTARSRTRPGSGTAATATRTSPST